MTTRRIFIASSAAQLRFAVCDWLISEAELSASNIVKLKLSNMANDLLNETWFEIVEYCEAGHQIIEEEIENEERTTGTNDQ